MLQGKPPQEMNYTVLRSCSSAFKGSGIYMQARRRHRTAAAWRPVWTGRRGRLVRLLSVWTQLSWARPIARSWVPPGASPLTGKLCSMLCPVLMVFGAPNCALAGNAWSIPAHRQGHPLGTLSLYYAAHVLLQSAGVIPGLENRALLLLWLGSVYALMSLLPAMKNIPHWE